LSSFPFLQSVPGSTGLGYSFGWPQPNRGLASRCRNGYLVELKLDHSGKRDPI